MDKDGYHGYKLHDSRPNTIRFYSSSPDSTEVLRISKDGIWANPDVPTDEAAKKVLEALGGHLSQMLDKAREEGRKESQEVTWGVDWGRAGDKSCAAIIKRLPDGRVEVVAVEYEP